MGFRFSRRIRILPGVWLNLSKSGVSTSNGGRGAWSTFGKRGTRTTVGIPGTGISYTHVEAQRPAQQEAHGAVQPVTVSEPLPKGKAWRGLVWAVLLLALFACVVRLAVASW
jgi:hypothetical protein